MTDRTSDEHWIVKQ